MTSISWRGAGTSDLSENLLLRVSELTDRIDENLEMADEGGERVARMSRFEDDESFKFNVTVFLSGPR